MTDGEKWDLAAIARVWPRVSAAESAGPEPVEPKINGLLRRFIENAARAGGMYALLALKLRGGPGERELRELSAQERDTEHHLQTEYLLLTGDTHAPPPSHPSAPYPLRALRDAHAAELSNAQALDAAASQTPAPLCDVLAALANRERLHAQTLREVIALAVR